MWEYRDSLRASGLAKACPAFYQTRQALALTMGWPGLQENAF